MPLVSRLARQETASDMLLSANARYEEGLALLAAGYRDGGLYLMGYAAEMILKTAFCRIDPTALPYVTVRSRFGIAERHWPGVSALPLPSGYEHSLIFWETVLPAERAARGKPALGVMVSQTLSGCVRDIAENWAVKMRYQQSNATVQEANSVRSAASAVLLSGCTTTKKVYGVKPCPVLCYARTHRTMLTFCSGG